MQIESAAGAVHVQRLSGGIERGASPGPQGSGVKFRHGSAAPCDLCLSGIAAAPNGQGKVLDGPGKTGGIRTACSAQQRGVDPAVEHAGQQCRPVPVREAPLPLFDKFT